MHNQRPLVHTRLLLIGVAYTVRQLILKRIAIHDNANAHKEST